MTSSPALRRTPLHEVHVSLGASFTDFGGWDMPLRYASDLAEHRAVRTAAGLFDLSHMGEVWVRGPQAGAALDHALTGRAGTLGVGRARYMMIVDTGGGVLDDLIVYRVCEERYLVVPNAGNRERVAAALAERVAGFQAQVEDVSDDTALLAVQGPRAVEVLSQVVDSGVASPAALRPVPPDAARQAASPTSRGCGEADVLCGGELLARLRYYAVARATAAGHRVLLARTGYTGEDGFEIFCAGEDAVDLWEVVTRAAAALPGVGDGGTTLPALTPCGLAARDSLRLEAGMALYGHELSEEVTPLDAGLAGVVKLGPEDPDFVGRSALAERSGRDGQAGTWMLVALRGQGRRAARAGCTVLGPEGQEVGEVTSGLLSPTLGYPIALARLRPGGPAPAGTWPVGTRLSVDVRGRGLPMEVVTPPFYRRPR